MLPLDEVNKLSAHACFAAAATFNTLLIWLIKRKSTAELKPYARILLQMSVIDLALASLTFLHAPVVL